MKLYDVVIKDLKGNVVETVGKALPERKAVKREMTALSRIDVNNYFVSIIESKQEK